MLQEIERNYSLVKGIYARWYRCPYSKCILIFTEDYLFYNVEK